MDAKAEEKEPRRRELRKRFRLQAFGPVADSALMSEERLQAPRRAGGDGVASENIEF